MKRKVAIKSSSMPTRSPVAGAVLYWLLLDRLAAPAWAYGVLWTLVSLGVFAWLYCFFTTEERDVPGFGERK
jgi:hypothetical protein